MPMMRLLVPAAALAAVCLPVAASGTLVHPQLKAKVGARGISLTDAKGQRVRVLLQNSHRITVTDTTRSQNFHLVGPGVDVRTRVSATGTRTWVVNLRPGVYVYSSDGSAKLRGTFTVRDTAPPA